MIAVESPNWLLLGTYMQCNKEIARKFCFVKVHINIAAPCSKTSDIAFLGAFAAMTIHSA